MQIIIAAPQEEDPIAHAIAHIVECFAEIADIWLFPDGDGMELASCETFMTRPLLLIACPPHRAVNLMDNAADPVRFFGGRDPEVTVLLYFRPTPGQARCIFPLPCINRQGVVHELQVEPDASPESIARMVVELLRPALG